MFKKRKYLKIRTYMLQLCLVVCCQANETNKYPLGYLRGQYLLFKNIIYICDCGYDINNYLIFK